MRWASPARWPTRWCSWITAGSSRKGRRQACSTTPSTSGRGNFSAPCAETAVAMSSVWTALGPVDQADLGLVLPHEHLFINMLRERRGDGLVNDPALVTGEVEHFRRLGGRTIV